MSVETDDREDLLTKIRTLEDENARLNRELQEQQNRESDWSGNLGRWYWDVSTNTVSFNVLKTEALGYSESDLGGPVGFEFFTTKIHPEDYERVMDNMRGHLHRKVDAYDVEYRIRTKAGLWKWFYDRGIVTSRDSRGQPLAVAGIVFDITKTKDLEESLRRSNSMKDQFFSILAHDLRGPIGNLVSLFELMEADAFEKSDWPTTLAALRS